MFQAVVGTARLPFLILAPLCVSVSLLYANFLSLSVKPLDAALCIIAAILAHASANMLNEYRNHVSGHDLKAKRTAFTGGTGTLQKFPEQAKTVNTTGWVLLALSTCIGVYFVLDKGIDLIPIGFLGVALVAFYTPQINRLPLICLVAPGFGFAIVLMVGSFIAITGKITFELILLAFPIFMLTNNLLLLNQYPDVDADKSVGRSHMIIRYGLRHGMKAYLYHIIVTVFATMFIIMFFQLKTWGMLLLLPSALGILCYFGLRNYIDNKDLKSFVPYLGLNIIACVSYPLLLSILLWIN